MARPLFFKYGKPRAVTLGWDHRVDASEYSRVSRTTRVWCSGIAVGTMVSYPWTRVAKLLLPLLLASVAAAVPSKYISSFVLGCVQDRT